MVSTRNKNWEGNYLWEQNKYSNNLAYRHFSGFGVNDVTYLPDNGLLPGKIHHSLLSHNHHDIESDLFGIGSTNLVVPKVVDVPQFKKLKYLSICDRNIVYMPEPLVVKKDERPFFG